MDIQYKSIFDMQQITKLIESDKFLVARGSDTWYTTKSMTYANLSSDLADVLSNIKFDLKIINDRSALAGGDKMVASARVTGLIDNDLTLIKNNYISKSEDQVISKNWGFSKIPTCSGSYTVNTPPEALATVGKVNSMIASAEKPPLYTNTFISVPNGAKQISLSTIIPSEKRKDSMTIWYSIRQHTGAGTRTPDFSVSDAVKTVKICGTDKIKINDKKLTAYQQKYAWIRGLSDKSKFNSTIIKITPGDGCIAVLNIYEGLVDFSVEATV